MDKVSQLRANESDRRESRGYVISKMTRNDDITNYKFYHY